MPKQTSRLSFLPSPPSQEALHPIDEPSFSFSYVLVIELISKIPSFPSYKETLMVEGTCLSQLKKGFNSLKQSSKSQFKSLETMMIALK